MIGLTDTTPEAQQVLSAALRAMTPARKLRLVGQAYCLARSHHEAGRRGRGELDDLGESWNAMVLGPDLWNSIKGGFAVDRDADQETILREVVGVFERLGIAYAVGGSWASSIHGEARLTLDADISVEPFAGYERAIAGAFGPEYYLSLGAIMDAVRRRSTFNIIHVPSAFKVDVFVARGDGFEASMMSRRAPSTGPDAGEKPLVWVSAEDVILLKLRWYRLGNEVSERQVLDTLGVIRTQGDRLDTVYIERWADELGVRDLWDRVRGQA